MMCLTQGENQCAQCSMQDTKPTPHHYQSHVHTLNKQSKVRNCNNMMTEGGSQLLQLSSDLHKYIHIKTVGWGCSSAVQH